MKLAYSSNAYTRATLLDAIDSIGRLGYDGIEILCDHPHWFPGHVDQRELEAVRDRIAEYGLSVSNLNANTANVYFDPLPPENVFEPSLSSADEGFRRWRIDYTTHAIELARAIGSPCVSVTSGHPGSGGLPTRGLELMTDSLKRICEVAEASDVRIGIEYEPGLLVERASEVLELIDRVGSDRLGVNLDIGHSHLSREDPGQTIRALAGRIWNVHVEDIAALKHFHLVPGTGDMPLADYVDAFRAIGYDNFLTVELYTFPDQPERVGADSLAYLRNLCARPSSADA